MTTNKIMSYVDPKTVDFKEHVRDGQKVHFVLFRDDQFWYETEKGYRFPISLEEVRNSKVSLLASDKALLFMRWMRKYKESMTGLDESINHNES